MKQFLKYKNQFNNKYYFQNYIINYKSKKKKNINNVIYFFKKLLINIFQN